MKFRKSTIIIMLISIVMFIISILFLFTNFFSNIFISPKELDYRELDNKLISVQNETTDYINSFNNIGSNIVNGIIKIDDLDVDNNDLSKDYHIIFDELGFVVIEPQLSNVEYDVDYKWNSVFFEYERYRENGYTISYGICYSSDIDKTTQIINDGFTNWHEINRTIKITDNIYVYSVIISKFKPI